MIRDTSKRKTIKLAIKTGIKLSFGKKCRAIQLNKVLSPEKKIESFMHGATVLIKKLLDGFSKLRDKEANHET